MKKIINITVFLLLFPAVCWAGGSKDAGKAPASGDQQQKVTAQSQIPASPYFTGDGGRGKSITILPPRGSGLAKEQAYLPDFVANELVSNFNSFSAMTLFDRVNNQKQYDELLSGYYADSDKAGMDLGHMVSTDYMLLGDITKTSTGYALQLTINRNNEKTTAASYSGTVTIAELDNLTGIRKASLDLLQKIGVTLTAKAKEELTKGAAENNVNAQTALAKGITAQRQGTEVAALSYYFQAAAIDPSLAEAFSRSSILNTNISSGNIGDNIRNDIQWRKDWVARLTETEQYFDSFNKTASMPYTLFYVSDEIKQGAVNYQKETVNLSIETHLHGSGIWTVSIERALQAVYDGLEATKRKDIWGLGGWPQKGVTNLNAFSRRNGNFTVVFELLNNQNKVIGKQTLQTGGYWELRSGRPSISVNADDRKTLNFQNVNANDITDSMTIRVATVNGTPAETAAMNGVLQIRSITKNQFDNNGNLRFVKGEIQGFNNRPERKQGATYILNVPGTIWGDPVISIGKEAFVNMSYSEVNIPEGIISIGERAFANNDIRKISIGANASIADNAFEIFINEYTGSDGKYHPAHYESSLFAKTYDKNRREGTSYRLERLNTYTWYISKIPSAFIGTWKCNVISFTLVITENTIKPSNAPSSTVLLRASDNPNSYFIIGLDINIKLESNGDLIIRDNRRSQISWNGTWKKL